MKKLLFIILTFLYLVMDRQFPVTRQMLDLPLTPHRLFLGSKYLLRNKAHRTTRLRILRALSRIMCSDALRDVVGPPRIECAIRAAYDVGISAHFAVSSAGQIVTCFMTTSSSGRSEKSVATLPILCTTSMPLITLPKIV